MVVTMDEIIKFNIQKQHIQTDRKSLVKGTVNVYECEFTFDEEWDGFVKTAVFINEEINKQVMIVDDKCSIPWEVLSHTGYLYVGVYGVKDDMRYPTIYTDQINVVDGCDEGGEPLPPTPTVWEEILKTVNEINAKLDVQQKEIEKQSKQIKKIKEDVDKLIPSEGSDYLLVKKG